MNLTIGVLLNGHVKLSRKYLFLYPYISVAVNFDQRSFYFFSIQWLIYRFITGQGVENKKLLSVQL